MIIVRLPDSLSRKTGSETLAVADPVETMADLIDVLDRRLPGFRGEVDDALYNFAVNDGMLLHGVRERTLRDGDVVELIPTISGGCASASSCAISRRPASLNFGPSPSV